MIDIDAILSALAHPTRRQALRLLRKRNELCLCELMAELSISQPSMSRHMSTLRDAGLVSDRRVAQWVRYRRHPMMDKNIERLVTAVLAADDAHSALFGSAKLEEDVA